MTRRDTPTSNGEHAGANGNGEAKPAGIGVGYATPRQTIGTATGGFPGAGISTPAIESKPTTERQGRGRAPLSVVAGQAGRKVLAFLAAHAALLVGVAMFLFPFLWMVSTSLKTDEELPEARVLPHVPTFRPHSPYVKETPDPARPIDVPAEEWDRLLPSLLDRAAGAIATAQSQGAGKLAGDGVDATKHREAAARVLVDRAVVKLNRNLWTGPSDAFDAAFAAQLTPEASAAALNESLARVELLQVQLRTLDTQIFTLTPGPQMAGAFRVESGPATVVDTGSAALLQYDFATPDAAPIVLRYDFAFPENVRPADLHKLTVSIRADDSWHRVDAVLDMAGERWRSQRTTPIAQHRPMSLIFQPPTFDDTTDRAKTWIPLRPEGPASDEGKGDDAPLSSPSSLRRSDAPSLTENRATLRLTISPSSTAQAVRQKAERNYERAFYAVPFWKYVFNSVLLVVLTTAGALFSASFVAYAFARLNWPGRGFAFLLLLSTMMLPGQVTMIPSFMIWRELGWYNTLNPLWVPAWFGAAFFIFLMTQHMKTIPKELEEAAKLDGLNALQSWYYVILPQVKPTLAAIAILSFMGAWNEFMGPLIYLRDQDKFPLSLGLFGMRVEGSSANDWTMMMAGNVLMTLPVIVIFFIFQRYFIQGMTMSGMKG